MTSKTPWISALTFFVTHNADISVKKTISAAISDPDSNVLSVYVFFSTSKVSVTGREDVPPFGPVIPDPPLFTDVGNNRISSP